jgi:hypothetical protein
MIFRHLAVALTNISPVRERIRIDIFLRDNLP